MCNAAVGQVQVVSLPTAGFVQYLEAFYLLDYTFGVHLPGTHFLMIHVTDTLNSMSANIHSMITSKRQDTQGPDGTPATKTIKSVQMIQYRVRESQQFFDNIYRPRLPS